jgi:hypothetical protein
LLHTLASTHYGDAAYLALKFDAVVEPFCADRGGNGVRNDGEVIESFFDEETDDAVAVEDEIGSSSVSIADDG